MAKSAADITVEPRSDAMYVITESHLFAGTPPWCCWPESVKVCRGPGVNRHARAQPRPACKPLLLHNSHLGLLLLLPLHHPPHRRPAYSSSTSARYTHTSRRWIRRDIWLPRGAGVHPSCHLREPCDWERRHADAGHLSTTLGSV